LPNGWFTYYLSLPLPTHRGSEGETCTTGLRSKKGEHAPQGKEWGNMLWGVGVRLG